jgi:hypothetical protein
MGGNMDRRKFLGVGGLALTGAAITWPTARNRREKHQDEVVHRGSITLPAEVIHHALAGQFYRTTSRHEAIRFKLHGVLFLLRELSPSLNYVGEIVRTQSGQTRVHLWKVIETEGRYAFTFERPVVV